MVQSKDCRECAKEIKDKVKRPLEDIIKHRSKCRKCIGCERLNKAKEADKSCDDMNRG